jgi:cell division protein FtsN
MSKSPLRRQNHRTFNRKVLLSAGALLAFTVLVGLQDPSAKSAVKRHWAEVRLMPLTGFVDASVVVRKRIDPPSSAVFSAVVTRKIAPPPPRLPEEASPLPPAGAARATNAAARPPQQPNTVDTRASAAHRPRYGDQWQTSPLMGTLLKESETPHGFSSVPGQDAPAAVAAARAPERAVPSPRMPEGPPTPPAASPSAATPASEPGAVSPQEAQADSERSPSLPYSLQLSSCHLRKNAELAANQIREKGLEPFIVNVYLKNHGGSWWRVLAGQYASVDAALRAKRAYRLHNAIVKRTRYANLIGAYARQDVMCEMKNRLQAIGFSTYSVDKTGGGVHLFAGAFTRRHQAEAQAAKLRAGGVECRVVAR